MAWIAKLATARTGLLVGALLLVGTRAGYGEYPDQDSSSAGDTSIGNTTSSSDRDDPHWVMDERTQCWAYNSHAGTNDSVRWSGGCSGEEISGAGTLTFFNDGKMAERITGTFGNGLLEDGHVTIAWANGTYYDGDEQHGHFNGQGLLIEPNGSRFEGLWQDDVFKGPSLQQDARVEETAAMAAGARLPTPPVSAAVSPAAAATGAAVAEEASAPQAVADSDPTPQSDPSPQPDPSAQPHDDTMPKGGWAFLDAFFDGDLVSVDGSTLTLTRRDDGSMERAIQRPDGMAQKAVFSFMSGRLGTVRDPENGSDLIATFRMTDGAMTIDYADGRSETVAPSPDGGLMIAYDVPGSALYQVVWYPQGHVFSREDREAALMQYADRLDVTNGSAVHDGDAKPRGGSPARLARSMTEIPNVEPMPKPTPPSDLAVRDKPATQAAIVPPVVARTVHSVATLPPTATRLAALTAPPIIVQTSQVHPIDAPTPKRSASDCLSVESDGTHWGFRNHCATDVQFAYCELNSPDHLTACDHGAVPGSVAAHGFGALVADTSIKDANASHSFRWVACIGGAGEVEAKLDQPDPPSGRCLHAGDVVDSPQQRADASGGSSTHATTH